MDLYTLDEIRYEKWDDGIETCLNFKNKTLNFVIPFPYDPSDLGEIRGSNEKESVMFEWK